MLVMTVTPAGGQNPSLEPAGKMPRATIIAICILAIEGLLATAFAGLGIIAIATSESDFDKGWGLWGFLVGAPPAAICWLAIHGLWRRKKWGYILSLIALVGLAVSAAAPFVSEPETIRDNIIDPPRTWGGLLRWWGWLPVTVLNLFPAFALLRRSVRAWFDLGPRRSQE